MLKSVLLLVFVIGLSQADLCQICTDVLEIAIEYAPEGEEKLKEKLDEYCNDLGGFSTFCKLFVDAELQNILNWLESGNIDAHQFCKEIHLCKN